MMYPNPLRSITIITFAITAFSIHRAAYGSRALQSTSEKGVGFSSVPDDTVTAAQEIQWGVLSAKDVSQMGPFELTPGWYELRVEFISGQVVGAQRFSMQNHHRSAVFNLDHFAHADITS